MTRERAIEIQEVFNAFCDGKQIQSQAGDGVWEDISLPEWFFEKKYRVKPEQRMIWVNVYKDGSTYAYSTEVDAGRYLSEEGKTIKFIEVTE